MNKYQKVICLSSGIIGLISLFTPIIFHIAPISIYQFWVWGFGISYGQNLEEINITYLNEPEFLIPAIFSMCFIILGSFLILTGLRKNNSKYLLIGSLALILAPLVLSLIWQFIYVLFVGYPTFWGSAGGYNYYLPSFSMYLQVIAGLIALISLKLSLTDKN